ncbi:MAG: hypothetical protein WBQ41_09735 [Solirubrobacterales bacterium]
MDAARKIRIYGALAELDKQQRQIEKALKRLSKRADTDDPEVQETIESGQELGSRFDLDQILDLDNTDNPRQSLQVLLSDAAAWLDRADHLTPKRGLFG